MSWFSCGRGVCEIILLLMEFVMLESVYEVVYCNLKLFGVVFFVNWGILILGFDFGIDYCIEFYKIRFFY